MKTNQTLKALEERIKQIRECVCMCESKTVLMPLLPTLNILDEPHASKFLFHPRAELDTYQRRILVPGELFLEIAYCPWCGRKL